MALQDLANGLYCRTNHDAFRWRPVRVVEGRSVINQFLHALPFKLPDKHCLDWNESKLNDKPLLVGIIKIPSAVNVEDVEHGKVEFLQPEFVLLDSRPMSFPLDGNVLPKGEKLVLDVVFSGHPPILAGRSIVEFKIP